MDTAGILHDPHIIHSSIKHANNIDGRRRGSTHGHLPLDGSDIHADSIIAAANNGLDAEEHVRDEHAMNPEPHRDANGQHVTDAGHDVHADKLEGTVEDVINNVVPEHHDEPPDLHDLHHEPDSDHDHPELHDLPPDVDPLVAEWMMRGLEKPLPFFLDNGEPEDAVLSLENVNIKELFVVEEFSVEPGEPYVHEAHSANGLVCSFHFTTVGYGQHADKEMHRDHLHSEVWRMYFSDMGTHHECAVTTTALYGDSAMNFTYARLMVLDPNHEPIKLSHLRVWPASLQRDFESGHTHAEDDHSALHSGRRIDVDRMHGTLEIPDGYGLVSRNHWSGKLAQASVHFVPTAARDHTEL
jgi:hypothetical protein